MSEKQRRRSQHVKSVRILSSITRSSFAPGVRGQFVKCLHALDDPEHERREPAEQLADTMTVALAGRPASRCLCERCRCAY
jgi:hypothetical protein